MRRDSSEFEAICHVADGDRLAPTVLYIKTDVSLHHVRSFADEPKTTDMTQPIREYRSVIEPEVVRHTVAEHHGSRIVVCSFKIHRSSLSGRSLPVEYYYGLLIIQNWLLVKCEIFVVL